MPRLTVAAVFALAVLVLAAPVAAQVYKWKDANGTTHYSDAPPPTGSKYDKVNISSNVATPVTQTPVSAATSAAPAKTAASAQAAKPAGSMPDTPANRATLCKQLDSNIALLNSKQSLTAGDANSPQENMSDTQRQQQLATAQAQRKQYCSG